MKNQISLQNDSVTMVGNGVDALKAVEHNHRFDLVLLDVMMPGMSGYEVCQQISW
ncbi:response regulator [Desulfobacterales bacterium HSG2]|nr:response regulator [Desulfobacterales bacterium HSG2]